MADELGTQEIKSTQKPERLPGNTILPIARIKRVIKEDKDVSLINAEATFCIAYATELFMEYLVTEAFSKAKKDKRKTVYYKDLAGTVKEIEQFEFLEDVIPPTMTLKTAIEKRQGTVHEESTASIFPTPPFKKQKTKKSLVAPVTTNEPAAVVNDDDDAEEAEEEETNEVEQGDDEEMEEPKTG